MKIAILLHGEENEEQMPKLFDIQSKLQKQLDEIGSDDIDVVYIVNNTNTLDEKKEWLLSQTEAKSYVFIDHETVIDDLFLAKRLNAMKGGRKTNKQLLDLGIFSKLAKI
jgi:hypothetical protein